MVVARLCLTVNLGKRVAGGLGEDLTGISEYGGSGICA